MPGLPVGGGELLFTEPEVAGGKAAGADVAVIADRTRPGTTARASTSTAGITSHAVNLTRPESR
jgi:hypothetical protein